MKSFKDLGTSSALLKKLNQQYIFEPTEIQTLTMPPIYQGESFVAEAPTGSGKTLAFLLPLIDKIENSSNLECLVIVPTRELVLQISTVAKDLSKDLNVLSIYGGQEIQGQLSKLKGSVNMVIATPGRLIDHLRRESIQLDTLKCLILDEIDQLIDMGFQPDLDVILKACPEKRQTLGFSATISQKVKKQAYKMMASPYFISTKKKSTDHDRIDHFLIETTPRKKQADLVELLHKEHPFLCIIFCRTRRRVEQLETNLHQLGFNCKMLHGGMPQNKRQQAIKAFRDLSIQYLVATEVAARGLDITGVSHVINYDMPESVESYVHRIGRTGRIQNTGKTYLFSNPEDQESLNQLKKSLKITFNQGL
jgi:superfamily II DNA/RNA helicase